MDFSQPPDTADRQGSGGIFFHKTKILKLWYTIYTLNFALKSARNTNLFMMRPVDFRPQARMHPGIKE